ncbi:ribonuclease J [Pleurocapsales cyanobacterium LEGE 10410]|nr:ribonuclease J [Pleurocapsales cyanobacterium LEGE 10410]
MNKNKTANKPTVKIIPLGGLHEIGKNTCVFEYEDEIILLDAGLGFPNDRMHGINIVLPDMTYLRENSHRIKGMIVTHGHEDHIGGIAYHLKQFDIPVIYGPRLAMSLLSDKLEEAGVSDRTTLKSVVPREIVKIGRHFRAEYIRNTHSIADSFSVAIHTPIGVIVHSGDFKFDHTPVDGEHFDIQKLAEHGAKGVLCLLSDSTNAEVPGHTPSERSVYPNLDRIFGQAAGRLMVTTFSSSVHRVNMILDLARKHGRKVAVVGRSMLNVIAHARKLGYIQCRDDIFEPLRSANRLPDDKILILSTGSQGEELSAMTRISKGEHRQIRVREGDTIVFSANPIPGNTIGVVNTIDRLMMQGAKVIYGRKEGIHVSGHGAREDHKLMLNLTRPKFFVPVHGEHRMLIEHAGMAKAMGVPEENIVIIKNGNIIELTENSIGINGEVPSGIELVDRSGIVQDNVMKERQQLAEDGVVTVAAAVDWSGKLVAPPALHLRGVVTSVEQSLLQQLVVRNMERVLSDRWSDFSQTKDGETEVDWTEVRLEIEGSLQRLMKRELRSRPLVVFLLQTPEKQPTTSTSKISRRRKRSSSVGTPAPVISRHS